MGLKPVLGAAAEQAEAERTEAQKSELAAIAIARANAAQTPAALAQLIVEDPRQIEAYVRAAHQRQGSAFVRAALELARNEPAEARAPAIGPLPGAEPAAHDPELEEQSKALSRKWGIHPHRFEGLLDGSNTAELIFRDTAPRAIEFINVRAKALGHTFALTLAELVTNFIAEGGFVVLDHNVTRDIDGFGSLGLDTFMNQIARLRPWLHPSIAERRLVGATHKNEKGENVQTITELTLVQAIYASAAMLALTKSQLDHDCKATGQPLGRLSDSEQFYFETLYFNAGPGYGKQVLQQGGASAAHRRWDKGEGNQQWGKNPQFNASWRTASYELMNASTLPGGRFRPPTPESKASGAADLGDEIGECKVQIGALDELIAEQRARLVDAATTMEEQRTIRQRIDELIGHRAAHIEMLAEMMRLADGG